METLALFKHLQVLLLLAQLALLGDFVLDLSLEAFELDQSVLREIFGRRLVLLHALKVLDYVLSLELLFVNDRLELVVLLVDFLQHFFLKTFLAHHPVLHVRARLQGLAALRQNRLVLGDLTGCRLLQRHALAAGPVIREVTVVTKSHIVCLTENCELLVMRAVFNLAFHLLIRCCRTLCCMHSRLHL